MHIFEIYIFNILESKVFKGFSRAQVDIIISLIPGSCRRRFVTNRAGQRAVKQEQATCIVHSHCSLRMRVVIVWRTGWLIYNALSFTISWSVGNHCVFLSFYSSLPLKALMVWLSKERNCCRFNCATFRLPWARSLCCLSKEFVSKKRKKFLDGQWSERTHGKPKVALLKWQLLLSVDSQRIN